MAGVGRKTAVEQRAALRRIKARLKSCHYLPNGRFFETLKKNLRGHKGAKNWLNRRSQRKSHNREKLNYQLPESMKVPVPGGFAQ